MIYQDSISNQVYEEIKKQILAGKFTAGMFLSVDQISLDLGVSRTPVQEAFKRLSENGLIILRPRSKAMVPCITPKEASDIADTRIGIEQLALQKINYTLFSSVYEHLKEITDNCLEQLTLGNRAEAFLLDSTFHTELIQTTGNDTLLQLYKQLNFKAQLLRLAHTIPDQELTSYIQQHYDLLDLIKTKKIEEAKKLLEIHINHQNSRLSLFGKTME